MAKLFFNTHLGYSFNFTVFYLCQIMGGIPPPSGGIVGKNRSTRKLIVDNFALLSTLAQKSGSMKSGRN